MTDNVPAPQDAPKGDLVTVESSMALSQSVIDETTSGAGFLPYLQLFTAKSSACSEGKVPIGHYGLVQDGEITDLGTEINVLVLSARPRAYQKTGDGNILVVHDKDDPEYARIAELQKNKVNGCMVGPEVLVFIESTDCYASFFCGSPTLRREAKKLKPLMGKAATLRAKLIDNGEYKWHGPVITPCSVGLDPYPDDNEMGEQITRFLNPPKPRLERAPEAPGGGDDVDR